MDRIADAHEPIGMRIHEAMQEEDINEITTARVPTDDGAVDTDAFLQQSALVFGSEFVPKLQRPLLPGDVAPLFTAAQGLQDGEVRDINLADYKGKCVLLVFYPGDMSKTGAATMSLLTQLASSKADIDLVTIAVSTDSIKTHQVWAGKRKAGPPPVIMIADKPGALVRQYGVLEESRHTAHHAVFVIDTAGIIQGYRVSGSQGLEPDSATQMLEFVRASICPPDSVSSTQLQ